jgi:hypothetical protein
MSQTPRGLLPQYFTSEGYAPPQPFSEAREKQIASIETSGMFVTFASAVVCLFNLMQVST